MKQTPTPRGPRINIWLSEADKTAIQEQAKTAGLSVTDYLIGVGKGAVLSASDKRHYSREELTIFRNIGVNLNQLASHANRAGAWEEHRSETVAGLIGQLRTLLG